MHGKLTLLCGPMFSGKTTELLKRLLWASNGQGKKVAAFKPAYDQRYAKMKVVSHEGLSAEAEAIYHWGNTNQHLRDAKVRAVFLDEVQFFTPPNFRGDIVSIVQDLLDAGIDVVASGLDMDWQGKPFTASAMLAAMAEEIHKQKAICAVCGRPASRTYKKGGSQAKVEIGGNDLYEARCLRHWSMPEDQQVDLFDGFDELRPIRVVETTRLNPGNSTPANEADEERAAAG